MLWKSDRISGWGRIHAADMELSRPSRRGKAVALFKDSPAPAIGGLRSYGDAALKSDGHGHMMTRLDRFMSFDPATGILRAEAGISMRDILAVTLPKGWAPSALPGTGHVTLGGCIAMDVHGKDHRSKGSFGAQVLEITLIDALGKTHKASPKTKSRLFWATIGGLGQTGIILDAKIQMARGSEVVDITKTRFGSLSEGMALLETSEAQFNVAWIDASASGDALGRGILESSDYSEGDLTQRRSKQRSVPINLPKFAMSPLPTRLFNQIRYSRASDDPQRETVPFLEAQYPLDKLGDWNQLYGKSGFHQFQACFRLDQSEAAIHELLSEVVKAKAASPLVVMKRLGAEGSSLLGFPQEGFTVAIDMQNRSNTNGLLTMLTDITLKHDGRVYLAKDSSVSARAFKTMYPNWKTWAEICAKQDPEGAFVTDMVTRLEARP
ncbi:MAG: FAD-binding oxidoreductase [Pseudomonadota bacterium]